MQTKTPVSFINHSPFQYRDTSLRPQPKHHEPTRADFEAFGRRMYYGMMRKRELLNQLAQVNSDLDQAVSEISRQGDVGLVGTCSTCNYEVCICERLG